MGRGDDAAETRIFKQRVALSGVVLNLRKTTEQKRGAVPKRARM